nr:hypothetical protein [Tanacetum cinerariifolium]
MLAPDTPYKYKWAGKDVSVTEGSSETTTKRHMENYKNVSQDIRDQPNAEAEAVQIILTWIDNDIYSTDATYHKEKMLLCKQEEAGFQLNAEQADWRDDTDDEPED